MYFNTDKNFGIIEILICIFIMPISLIGWLIVTGFVKLFDYMFDYKK